MDDAHALAAARAFGTPAGSVRPVRGGAAPLFDVTLADGRRVALRLHDPATDPRHAASGARLAETLADTGLATPWPQRSVTGALTAEVMGTTASALQWVPATPPERAGEPAHLHAVGALLADFHLTALAVAPGDLHLPDRRPPTPAHRGDDPEMAQTVAAAHAMVAGFAAHPVGPVLDDPCAVLAGADGLWLIGIDRAGTGWPAQDLAAVLWPHVDTPEMSTLQDALTAGYRAGGGDAAVAAPDRIALCLLLRALHAAVERPDAASRARVAALAARVSG